jgi:hypothetical protein
MTLAPLACARAIAEVKSLAVQLDVFSGSSWPNYRDSSTSAPSSRRYVSIGGSASWTGPDGTSPAKWSQKSPSHGSGPKVKDPSSSIAASQRSDKRGSVTENSSGGNRAGASTPVSTRNQVDPRGDVSIARTTYSRPGLSQGATWGEGRRPDRSVTFTGLPSKESYSASSTQVPSTHCRRP